MPRRERVAATRFLVYAEPPVYFSFASASLAQQTLASAQPAGDCTRRRPSRGPAAAAISDSGMQKVHCRPLNVPTSELLAGLLLAAIATSMAGCQTIETTKTVVAETPANLEKTVAPSNHRNWAPHMAVLPRAEFSGDRLKVYNIRNFKYVTEDEYILDDYDETFDLNKLQSVDFILVPFKAAPSLAHTMLSFGFDDGRRLAVSVEVRLEEGESYNPVKGAMRQYEVMYVVGDERDLIKLRTQHRKSDVYIYRGKAAPEQARSLLVDIMQRVNKLNAAC
jgi:hypothetical protein